MQRGRTARGRLLLAGGLVGLIAMLLWWGSGRSATGENGASGPTEPSRASRALDADVAQDAPPILPSPTSREHNDAPAFALDAGPLERLDAGPLVFHSELQRCSALGLCGPQAICQRTHGQVGCFSSNCSGPWDTTSCGGDFNACRRVQWGGNTIHRCMPGGTVARGGTCSSFRYAADEVRCQPGLQCVAGYCVGRCQNDSCQSGERCVHMESEAVCLPASSGCEHESACASGYCLSGLCIERGTLLDGSKSCVPGDCEAGTLCAGDVDGHEARGVCKAACGDRPCPDGFACVSGGALAADQRVCAQQCRSGRDCARNEACRFAPGRDGLCEPAPAQDMSGSAQAIDEEVWATPDFRPAAN